MTNEIEHQPIYFGHLDSFFCEMSVPVVSTFCHVACFFPVALLEFCVDFGCESPVRQCVLQIFSPFLWIAFSLS